MKRKEINYKWGSNSTLADVWKPILFRDARRTNYYYTMCMNLWSIKYDVCRCIKRKIFRYTYRFTYCVWERRGKRKKGKKIDQHTLIAIRKKRRNPRQPNEIVGIFFIFRYFSVLFFFFFLCLCLICQYIAIQKYRKRIFKQICKSDVSNDGSLLFCAYIVLYIYCI